MSKARVVILGAGFGGLELSTLMSEAFGDAIDVTLIDKSDSFVFGYSKLDVMFGRTTIDTVRMPYGNFVKPGVRFVRQTVVAIDPAKKRITTERGVYDADFLIVALGAEYDFAATQGLADANEFYTVAGAERLREATADQRRVLDLALVRRHHAHHREAEREEPDAQHRHVGEPDEHGAALAAEEHSEHQDRREHREHHRAQLDDQRLQG